MKALWWCVAVVVVSSCSVPPALYRTLELCEFSQPADFAFTGTVTSVGPAPSVIGKTFVTVSASIDKTLWGTVPTQLVMATECSDVLGKTGSYFTSTNFHGTVVLQCLERKGSDIEYVVTTQTWPAATFEADLVASRSVACPNASGDGGVPVTDAGP
jgi:hypothetical protein